MDDTRPSVPDPSNEHLLRAIRATLVQRVRPEQGNPDVRELLDIVDHGLEELIFRETGDRSHARSAYTKSHALAVELARLARLASDAPVMAVPVARQHEVGISWEEISRDLAEVRAVLAQGAPLLAAALAEGEISVADQAAGRALLAQIADEDVSAVTDGRSDMSTGPASLASFDDHDLVPRLERYLQSRPESSGPLKIISVARPGGGFSRDTFVLGVENAALDDVVMRVQREKGNLQGLSLSVAQEYPLQSVLAAGGVPVARPLWLERDESLLGGTFMVMERAPGAVVGDNTGKGLSAIGETLLRDFARKLAQLQHFRWEDYRAELDGSITIDGVDTVKRAIEVYLDRWCHYLDVSRLSPIPSMSIMLDWLKRNIPDDRRRPVVDHGDLGFHNMLCTEHEVTALLDWEGASLNSPAKALGDVQDWVSKLTDWKQFLQWFVEAGGAPLAESDLNYFRVFRAFMAMAATTNAIERSFGRADHPDIHYLSLGVKSRRHHFRAARAHIETIWSAAPAISQHPAARRLS